MKAAEFRQAVDLLGTDAIAASAGTTRRSVERARVRGSAPRGKHGAEMRRAIETLSATTTTTTTTDEAMPEQGGANAGHEVSVAAKASVMYRAERAHLTRQRRIELERRNAVEAGELVSTSEVLARVLSAASVLRMGHENARRNVESVCCGSCRGPAAETVDEVFAAAAKAVGEALRG